MSAYDAAVLDDSPVIFLPLDDAPGSTTAVALAGSNGTYSGGPAVVDGNDAFGSIGRSFDGTDDYVAFTPTGLGTSQAQTWEFWYKDDSTIDSSTTPASYVGSDTNTYGIGFGAVTGTITGEVVTAFTWDGTGGLRGQGWTGFSITAGWHHHCLTFSGSSNGWNYYLDGVDTGTIEQASAQAVGMVNNGYKIAGFGASRYVMDGFAKMAVYDSQLSQSTIEAHVEAAAADARWGGSNAPMVMG